jgi:ribosomal protein L11 methyltransferase
MRDLSNIMENPFQQPKDLWCLELITEYKHLGLFDLAFEEKALTISSHEISSNNIEAEPNDIWMIQLYFDHEITHNIIPEFLTKYIKSDSIKIEYIQPKDWSLEPSSLRDLKTTKFHIMRDPNNKEFNLIPVLINITRAFGTGDHATTLGCIESMEEYHDRNIKSVLDIGTGSGILAICAKKLWHESRVVGTDIDEVALEVSQKHAALNEVDIEFRLDLPIDAKFDLILANILARPLIEMAGSIEGLLNIGGIIILSGFLDNQLDDIVKEYQKYNFSPISTLYKDRWVTLVLS